MKNKSIFVMSLTFLLFIIFWIVGETIIFGDAILETSRIKSFFLNNKNIQRIERMVSQKDFQHVMMSILPQIMAKNMFF